jgi:small-conductance mechanosensitive channel
MMHARSALLARALPPLLAVAVAVLLWGAYGVASTYRMFGSDTVTLVFHAAALAASTALVVWGLGRVLGGAWLGWALQHEPTMLQRRLVSALVAFVSVSLALRALGMDVATLLASSALVSLLFGLSVQPMLTSLVSGLTVQRHLRIGDGVVHDGEACRVDSLNWRTVSLRRTDGSRVDVPNAKLADAAMQVLAKDRPIRCELALELPSAWTPARVRRLVSAVVESAEGVEAPRGVSVLAGASDAGKPTLPYRVRFWVGDFLRRSEVQARIHARLWNALRREDPQALAPDWTSDPAPRPGRSLVELAAHGLPAGVGVEAIADDDVLPYDDGERLVVPERLAGRVVWLAAGAVSGEPPAGAARGGDAQDTGHGASLARVERRLAERIGPYAALAVQRAAAGHADLAAICTELAQEIDDPAERAAFLREVAPKVRPVLGAGRVLTIARDSAHQRLVTAPALWAVGDAVLVALPVGRRDVDATRHA